MNDDGKRIDKIIRRFIPEQSLSAIYKALRKGMIRLNDRKAKSESKVYEGDEIHIYKALLSEKKSEENLQKLNLSIENQIIWENDDLLAINKRRGQLVHDKSDSMDKMVQSYLKDKLPPSLSFKPGPLHRLDRNTSGLIFFSKSLKGARSFSEQLQSGAFIKYYVALVDGIVKNEEKWIDNLQRDDESKKSSVGSDGARSVSTAFPLIKGSGKSLILVAIETGRTHQIRVQCAHHGFPLSGDKKYGGSPLKEGYILHSLAIRGKNHQNIGEISKIQAQIEGKDLKRLIHFFPGCTINKLKKLVEDILEER